MFYLDADYLDYKIKTAKTTKEAVAAACGLNRSTLWRRVNAGTLTIADVHAIILFLDLTEDDIRKIFFARKVA